MPPKIEVGWLPRTSGEDTTVAGTERGGSRTRKRRSRSARRSRAALAPAPAGSRRGSRGVLLTQRELLGDADQIVELLEGNVSVREGEHVVLPADVGKEALDRAHRDEEGVDGQQDHGVAQLAQPLERQKRRAAARRVIEQQGGIEGASDLLDLGFGGGRLDEQHVGAGLR